jgi:hypothetical protein
MAFFVGGVVGAKKPSVFFRAKEEQKQLAAPAPGDQQALADWKKVFREVVIANDGGVSPVMERFLTDEESFRETAEAEKQRILDAAAAREKALLSKIEEQKGALETLQKPVVKDPEPCKVCGEPHDYPTTPCLLTLRTPLIDIPRAAFEADWKVCTSPSERWGVLKRWDAKGYRFPNEMRARLLKNNAGEGTPTGDGGPGARKMLRQLFDEQDTPPPKPPEPVVEKRTCITPYLHELLCIGCRHEAIWHGADRDGCCLRTHCHCARFQGEPRR